MGQVERVHGLNRGLLMYRNGRGQKRTPCPALCGKLSAMN